MIFDIIGESDPMQEKFVTLEKLKNTDANIHYGDLNVYFPKNIKGVEGNLPIQ